MSKKKINVLIVDDQPIVRRILSNMIKSSPEIENVYEAGDPYEARDMIERYAPDIMTLDVEMPKMNGLDFLKKLMPQYPMPVIMLSSFTKEGRRITLEALAVGAVDFVAKPDGRDAGLSGLQSELLEKIFHYALIDKKKLSGRYLNHSVIAGEKPVNKKIKLIAIGASTGGTNAIKFLLTNLPKEFPPIVIVQHMPQGFTKMFADGLREEYKINIQEAVGGEILQDNHLFIAQGNKHLTIQKKNYQYVIQLTETEKVNGHRPSVDVCFFSIANQGISNQTLAIILTGMGKDGAKGILDLKNKGAFTIGQDEESSVVYGMPKVAFDLGGITEQLSLFSIPKRMKTILENSQKING